MTGEERCPSCGALVSVEAEWCGQCYADLRSVVKPRSPAVRAKQGEPAWPCPVCESRNPIHLDVCAACGTPFAQLLREPERRPEVSPATALAWSLLLPGLGHWKCGRPVDGIARIVLFAWTLVTIVMILASRSGKSGIGAAASLFGLFLVAGIAVYVLSAVDAHRIASGAPELVTSRILLWSSAGLMLLAIILGAFVALPAVRGG